MIKSSLLCLILLLMPHRVWAQQGAERLNVAEVLDTDGVRISAVQPIPDPVEREPVRWTVVVASYPDRAVADTTAWQYHARLESMGYPVAVIVEETQGIATYRVIVGRFPRLAAAQTGVEALAGEIPAAAWLLNVHTVIPDEAWLPNRQAEAHSQPPGNPEPRDQALPSLEVSPIAEKPPPLEETPVAEAAPEAETPRDVEAEPVEETPSVVEVPSVADAEPAFEPLPVVETSSDLEREPVRWTVVVASYTERALAYAAATRYRTRLAPVAVAVMTEEAQGGTTYRVIAGRYQRLAEAQAGLEALASDVRDAAWLLNVQTGIPDDAWLPQDQPVADNPPSDEPEGRARSAVAPPSTAKAVSTVPVQSIMVKSPDLLYREHRHWAIVVASYAESAVADAAATRYRAQFEPMGYPVAVIAEEKQAVATYQVVVGEFPHLAAAEAGLEALSGKVPDGAWLFNVQAEVPDKAWLLYVQAVTGKPYPGLRELSRPILDDEQPDFAPLADEVPVAIAEEPAANEESTPQQADEVTASASVPSTVLKSPVRVDEEPVHWTVVLASYTERTMADTVAERLYARLQGEPVAVVAEEGGTTYRVIAGRHQRLMAAQASLDALPEEDRQAAWLLNVQTPIPADAWLSPEERIAVSDTPDNDVESSDQTFPIAEKHSVSETEPVEGELPVLEDEPIAEASPVVREAVQKELSTIKREAGTVEEESSIVEETPSANAPEAIPTPEAPVIDQGPMRWTVAVSSHAVRAGAEARAEKYRKLLASTGYQIAVVSEDVQDGVTYHRVVVGRFKRLAEARAALHALKGKVPEDAWLLHNKTPIPVMTQATNPRPAAETVPSEGVQVSEEMPPVGDEGARAGEAETETEADADGAEEPAAEVSPSVEAPAATVDLEPMRWTVVVASYPERAEAEATTAEYRTLLESMGYPVAVIDEGGMYHVVAGRFKKLATAQQEQQAMGDAVPATSWLLYVQSTSNPL